MKEKTTHIETIKVAGNDLVGKVKEIAHQGNARRIVIKNEEGKELIQVPLTLGVIGAVLLPVLAAVGALAALVTDCTIEIEREDE